MFTQITKTLSCFALPLFAIACGQPGEEALEDPSQVATTTSALCTDSGAANYSAALILGDVGGTVTSTSPTASYGSAACSGRYVVEATQTLSKPNLSASAVWADAGLSSTTCAAGKVSMLVYGFLPALSKWVQIGGEHIANGVMVPGPFGGPPSCSVAIGVSVPDNYSQIRVAAKASLNTVFGAVPRKVTGTIFAHH